MCVFSGRLSIVTVRALVISFRFLHSAGSSCCHYCGICVAAAVVVVQIVGVLWSSVLGFLAISLRVQERKVCGCALWKVLWWVGSVVL